MKTRCLQALLAIVVLGFAAAAAADESPRTMMFEVKFGPYKPSIDSEFGSGVAPYAQIYGDGSMLMSKMALDYEVFRDFGTIALGFEFGYGQQKGNGLKLDGTASTDETTFHVFPMSVSLIYRFDYLQQKFDVPLVPNIKGGFDYYFWWVTNGTGKIPQWQDPVTGNVARGRGGVGGAHVSFGLQFLLDWLAPDMATTFDNDIGVNNTYIFAEFVMSWINDFKVKQTLDLSSKTFYAGLAFEF